MAMIDDGDKYLQYRYELTEFYVLYNTSTYQVPSERISSISIKHDYENNIFPVFRIVLVLEGSVYYEIMANKQDLKFKIRIQKYYKERGKEEKSLYRDYLNATFSLILDDEANDYDASMRRNDQIEDDKNRLDAIDNSSEFFLYNSNFVVALKTEINDVLASTNMATAIGYVASKAGICGSILMSPPENGTTYNEVLLPSQNAIETIKYLDTNFGFYKKGSIIYFSTDYGYIINYAGGCTAYKKDELQDVCILVPSKNNPASADSGMLAKQNQTTRNYILVKYDQLDIQNRSVSNDAISGNNATIVDASTSAISTVTTGATGVGSKSSKVINNTTNNSYIATTYAAQTSANALVISFGVGDIDLDCVNPNKKYTFIFEDTELCNKYKGVYVIAGADIKFIKDGSDFSAECELVFKRVGDDPVTTETYIA